MQAKRTGWIGRIQAGLRRGLGSGQLPRLLGSLLVVCANPAAAFGAPKATLQHGPFEIVAQERRISSGTWPNISGNPFSRRSVTDFSVRWQGRAVEVPGHGSRFWQVLRLPDAAVPALLLVEREFTLVSVQDGQLRVQPLASPSNTVAETQWLDSVNGQPGAPQLWAITHVDLAIAGELERNTRLQGGRWLRLGREQILDLQTLSTHKVEPWVPMRPGEPVTSLSRANDRVRAFSPGRTAYVLAGSQTDFARGSGDVYGLLVVDIAQGTASELRVERRRMPFAHTDDMDRAWIEHYFAWQRDPAGRERLQARPGVQPLPWRGKLLDPPHDPPSYRVERVRPAFADELRRLLLALPGAELAPYWLDPKRGVTGDTVRVGECVVALSIEKPSLPDEDDGRVGVFAPSSQTASRATCLELLRRVAALADAELASGRHDALITLD